MSTIASSSRPAAASSPISTDEAQAGGPFMRLPAELRVMIYEQMFTPDKVDVYAIEGTLHKAEEAHHPAGEYVGILATCRTIHAESTPVLYHQTEFCIHIKDCYWLHFMDNLTYEQVYLREWHQKPRQKQWLSKNPWLQDPRSVVSLENVRKLSLQLEVSGRTAAKRDTWTPLLKHKLYNATNIRFLHIKVQAIHGQRLNQGQTDHTFGTIGQTIRCPGIVSGELDPWLAASDFNPSSYYRMLAAYGGLDKTNDVFERILCRLNKSQHSLTLRINDSVSSLHSSVRRSNALANEPNRTSPTVAMFREWHERMRLEKIIQTLRGRNHAIHQNLEVLKIQRDALDERRKKYLREVGETST